MKITYLVGSVLIASHASAWSAPWSSSPTVFQGWDKKDFEDYLHDNSIAFSKKSKFEELKDLALSHWEDLSHNKDDWAQYNQYGSWFGNNEQGWVSAVTSEFQNLKQKVIGGQPAPRYTVSKNYADAKSWVFDTWSSSDLEKLLKKAGVKYDTAKATTRSDLVKIAQNSYDDIARNFGASGRYTGDWLYSTWDTKALKKWLKEHDIPIKKSDHESLLKQVKESSYDVSHYVADQRDSVLESLDLSNTKGLFDKTGEIRDDVFNTWSSSDLYKWLKSHEVEIEESLKENKEELALLAQKNKHELKKDVESWIEKVKDTVSPILSKGSQKVDNVINDTFLVGVENWSRDRLKQFLLSRGVDIPRFATRWQLIQLVKENKYKPITVFNKDDFFKGWSKENLQKWLSEQGDAAQATGKDIWEKSGDYYKQFVNGIGFYASKISDSVDSATAAVTDKAKGTKHQVLDAKDSFFDYWTDVELQNYLKNSFGIKTHSTNREKLIKLAKDNTRWFVSGASYDAAGTNVSNLKYHCTSLWNWIGYKYRQFTSWLWLKSA